MPLIRVAGGRALAYEEFGDPAGRPVVCFHGAPGSRRFCPDAGATASAGVRLITYDRPGYGRSAPQPDRCVRDTAGDVGALLDHLAVERCAFVAWSGGGPFAVGAAHGAAERVTALALVSAPGPLDEVPGAWDALGDYQRPTAEMARREPQRSVRAIVRHMTPFLADPPSFLGRGRGADGAVFRGPHYPMLVDQVTEALVQGAIGVASDLVAMWLDWGFRLATIATPTVVFDALLDRHNHADARCYADRIPGARLVSWDDVGHLGVVPKWPEVLATVA